MAYTPEQRAAARRAANERYRNSPKGIEVQKAWRERNRERITRRKRQKYQENREQAAENGRKYYRENRDKVLERNRNWNEANQEQVRAYKERLRSQGWYRGYHLGRNHGLDIAGWWAIWEAQGGNCYLCGRKLEEDFQRTFVEHHHGCRAHDASKGSCRYCRRGLACASCNTTIGLNGDDPNRLRLIADALEAANLDVQARQQHAPEQLDLAFGETA